MKSKLPAYAVLAATVLLAAPPVRADDEGTPRSQAEYEVKQSKRLLAELQEEVRVLASEGYTFALEERFIDAQVYFDLKYYDKSALLFSSLLDDPRFKGDKRYHDGVRQLGIAQYNMGNLSGAAKQFEQLLASGVYGDIAVAYLVEIAARLNHADQLVKLAGRVPANTTSDTLRYAGGKALFFVGRYGEAMQMLNGVPASSSESLKARYVIGACLVALKQPTDAAAVFTAMSGEKPADPDQKKIVDLANLGLGRIAYEGGDYSASIDFYQRVPKESDLFEHALFEVTHVFLRWAATKDDPAERFKHYVKAEELLDILTDIARDPNVSRDARVMRGRISMYLEKYDQAREAYQEVIERFAATSGELTDIAQNPESIDRFFETIIRAGNTEAQFSLMASAEVIEWMRAQPTLGRVVDVLTDVARQRTTLEEAKLIYSQLDYSLSQQAARELFPGFSDVWLKSLEIENRLLTADGLLLQYESDMVEDYVSGPDATRMEQMQRERKRLQDQFASAPRTAGGYKARSREYMTGLRALSREADEQLLRIQAVQEQITAMQKLMREVKYKGSTMIEVKDEGTLTKEIQEEGDRLAVLTREAQALRDRVEKEMLVAEVGDLGGESERDVKANLWRQHGEEASFYIDRRENMKPSVQAAIDEANTVRREIVAMLDQVRVQQEHVDVKAQKLIVYYRKVLAGEKANLDSREVELRDTEKRAMAFARQVGTALLLEAKEGMVKAVVEADLGIVDLAWKQVRTETDEIDRLQKERAVIVDRLRAELEEIAGEAKTE